jgi:uncharacterized membrane protein
MAQALQRNASDLTGSGDNGPTGTIADVLLSERYKGSFPHPDVLSKLAECVEDGAERAFSLTEKEQQHRHECDRKVIDAQAKLIEAQVREIDAEREDRRLLIVLSFIFLVLAGAAAFWAVMTDHPAGAGILGTSSLVALSAALVQLFRSRSHGGKGGG